MAIKLSMNISDDNYVVFTFHSFRTLVRRAWQLLQECLLVKPKVMMINNDCVFRGLYTITVLHTACKLIVDTFVPCHYLSIYMSIHQLYIVNIAMHLVSRNALVA